MPRARERQQQQNFDAGVQADRDTANRYGEMFAREVERDPRDAFRESSRAAFDDFRTGFGENLERLRGNQVAMGRLRTGFGQQDEDELFTAMGRDLNTRLGSMALDAERLGMDRTRMIQQHQDRAQERATAAAGGEYQTLRQQRLSDRANRRRFWGNLASGVITAGATFLGGPAAGAAAAGATSGLRG